jgi:Fe-S-cluster containining protein
VKTVDRVKPESIAAKSLGDEVAWEQMARMSDHLGSILAVGGLESFAGRGALPVRVFDEFSAALQCYDLFIAHVLKAEGWNVTCRRGCTSCCHDLARGVTALEAIHIYRYVRPWRDVNAVYEGCGENSVVFQRLLAEEIRVTPGPLGPDDPRIVAAHVKYNRLVRPCPFLDRKEGACRIYPVRPFVCRHFFSLSPAGWCDPGHSSYLDRDTRCIEPHVQIKEHMKAINRRFGIRTLNFLSGAFVTIAGDVMNGRPLVTV